MLGGAPLCALSSTIACVLAVAFFYRLAELYGIRNPGWLAIAFSFHPWFWASGTHGLDYAWSLCCQVIAWTCVERGRSVRGGFWAALGFGFRPTSVGWIGALLLYELVRSRRWRSAAQYILATVAFGAVFVWLIALRPECWGSAGEAAAMNVAFINLPNLAVGAYRTVEFFGHLPGVLLLMLGVLSGRTARPGRERVGFVRWLPHLVVVAGYLSFFLINSGKSEYLLPALPAVFLMVGRRVRPGWWKAIAVAFLVNGLVSIDMGRAGKDSFVVERPTWRPGAVLWYVGRCDAANEQVARVAEELATPGAVVEPFRNFFLLNAVYVSSKLPCGPAGQARIDAALVPFQLLGGENAAGPLKAWPGLVNPPPGRVVGLGRCDVGSVVVFPPGVRPAAGWTNLIEAFCESGAQ
jgi:hypothetical protein